MVARYFKNFRILQEFGLTPGDLRARPTAWRRIAWALEAARGASPGARPDHDLPGPARRAVRGPVPDATPGQALD
jgi:hypothetical protein